MTFKIGPLLLPVVPCNSHSLYFPLLFLWKLPADMIGGIAVMMIMMFRRYWNESADFERHWGPSDLSICSLLHGLLWID